MRARRDKAEKAAAPTGSVAKASRKDNGVGVIRPNTGDLHPSSSLEDGAQTDPPSGVVLVIVALALIFIAIITYFVIQMPNKG